MDETSATGRVVRHDHVGEPEEDHQHTGLSLYYALRTTLPEPGVYDVEFDLDGVAASAVIQAFDRSEITVPLAGDRFPALETPTLGDQRGVDPICTHAKAPCPFHGFSIDELMLAGRPMAVLIATPAFCQTAYCGPVLDTLMEAEPSTAELGIVHIEPFANPRGPGGLENPALERSPAVLRLGLDFEPALFLVNNQGLLVDRIDNVFGQSELEEVLSDLLST